MVGAEPDARGSPNDADVRSRSSSQLHRVKLSRASLRGGERGTMKVDHRAGDTLVHRAMMHRLQVSGPRSRGHGRQPRTRLPSGRRRAYIASPTVHSRPSTDSSEIQVTSRLRRAPRHRSCRRDSPRSRRRRRRTTSPDRSRPPARREPEALWFRSAHAKNSLSAGAIAAASTLWPCPSNIRV
jgi:hypothetical protein